MSTTPPPISHRSPHLAGQTFGRLFVLARAHKDIKNRCWLWRCVCTCRMDAVVRQAVSAVSAVQADSAHMDAMQHAVLTTLCDYIDLAHIPTCLVRTQDLTGTGKQQSCGCLAREHRQHHLWKRRVP